MIINQWRTEYILIQQKRLEIFPYFCYAIDQSNLTVDAFMSRTYDKDPLIEEYKKVKKIGLWLYIKGKKKIHNSNNQIDILQLDSIMFLNKLVDWANKVVSANYKPIVVINYYE